MLDLPTESRLYHLKHSPCGCIFNPSPRDFVVREIPLYEPSGSGEHYLLYIRKKGLSTFELLSLLSNILGCKARDIGYAGLKDKAANTYQYISIHRSLFDKLKSNQALLEERQVKILSAIPHNNKLKIGHLKGNHFFIRLKKCTPADAAKIESILVTLAQAGFPNYFGYQRFGKYGDNYLDGKSIGHFSMPLKNKKISDFLISSYQSYLFNAWLMCRMVLSQILHNFSSSDVLSALKNSNLEALKTLSTHLNMQILKKLKLQKQPFVLLDGDIMCHYPFGKTFICDDTLEESKRFINADIAPTGALCGLKSMYAKELALCCEELYIDANIKANGSRRYAWVWAKNIESVYISKEAHFELQFTLPKGSYATTFIECLLGKNIDCSKQV